MSDLKEKLDNLPKTPGVYQFKDASGKIIYVGKAKVLRNRVRQYFQNKPVGVKTAAMVSKIADLDIITTDTEVEALILELNLIKSLKPRYNINLKDDKSYPYIVITNEPYPRVFPTRKKRNDGSKYFGPYTDVKTMRYALKSIRDIFMIRSCNLNLNDESIAQKKFKVCLDYHIHKCEGPCEGLVSGEEYRDMIKQVAGLLNGKTTSLIKEMKEKMNALSQNMMFEQAARMRDKIEALSIYSSRQKMVTDEIIDRDIFAVDKEDNDACGMVMKIRDGKVIGKSHYFLSNVLEKEDSEILENFVTNYYEATDFIPDEIFLQTEIDEDGTLLKWLNEKKFEKSEDKSGKQVKFTVPKIGDNAKLVAMVKANAHLMLEDLKLAKLKKEFIPPSLEALKRDLNMQKLPRRIECFDISHIQGTDTVASMITFMDGKPRKNDYRKYKIGSALNEVGEPDDFQSMREVIYRRYRAFAGGEEEQSDVLPMPDLIVIDGGKGQLSSAVKVLKDFGIKIENDKTSSGDTGKNSVFVISLAKRLEEVYFPGDPLPLNIPKSSSGLILLQRVRDEAHRFAVTFHQSRRDRRTLQTELTEIKGVGEKTAKKLLTLFGSVEEVKRLVNENYDEIKHAAGKSVAAALRKHYIQDNQTV
jgi:excinuclease ABC subunit C